MSYYDELKSASTEHAKNALLFSWLSDDEHRPKLYADLRKQQPVLSVTSRVKRTEGKKSVDQPVFLLTRRADIEVALRDFSNSPYKGISTGTFVLALDNSEGHADKRKFLANALRKQSGFVEELAALACVHALIAPSKQPSFDMVKDVAEQATLRFVSSYLGIPDKDHVPLQDAMRQVYDGMIVQMYARHFVSDLALIEVGKRAMAGLSPRIGQLIAEADFTQIATKIVEVIQMDPVAAKKTFAALINQVVKLTADPEIKAKGGDFLKRVNQKRPKAGDGIAFRMAIFLDAALNSAAVRLGLSRFILMHPALSPTIRKKLSDLIDAMVEKKEQPERSSRAAPLHDEE